MKLRPLDADASSVQKLLGTFFCTHSCSEGTSKDELIKHYTNGKFLIPAPFAKEKRSLCIPYEDTVLRRINP